MRIRGEGVGAHRPVVFGLVVCLLLAGLAGPAAGEIRRIEEMGTSPIRAGGKGAAGARDAALQAALREAVRRVAQSFLMDEEGGGDPDLDLGDVLGKRMVPYTTRFRVLEDRGERPAMFAQKGVKTEYVVVVEVFVDADRVEQRLIDAGLLERDPLAGRTSRIELELRGVTSYGAVAAVQKLLTEGLGATSAVPARFERGTAVLAVEMPGPDSDPGDVADQLASRAPPSLLIRVLDTDLRRAVLDVTWRP